MTSPIDSHDESDLDRLAEQDSRQILEARMLPIEGPLTDQQREELRLAAVAYCEKHKITRRDVARQVGGFDTSTAAQILKGTYKNVKPATLDEHLRAINDWMEADAHRRRTRPDAPFVETHVAKRLFFCALKTVEMCTMAAAHGPTGIGKTMVAQVIAERFPGTIFIRLSRGNTSFTALRQLLISRLRLYGRKRGKPNRSGLTINERIFEKLRDSHRLIIIDEAHKISDSGLDFLRDIFDECGVPILLLCTKDLVDRIRNDADEDHGQLYSRFGHTFDLTRGRDKTPGGRNPLFSIAEIRKMFASDKVRLLPDAQQYLKDVANMLGQGSLRRCRGIIQWAIPIARGLKQLDPDVPVTIGADLLRKAETQPRSDRSMLEDIESRRPAVAASG